MRENKEKRLTVALAGCGRVAAKHAKAFRHLRRYLQPTALVDARRDACEILNVEHKLRIPAENFYTGLDALYAAGCRPDIVAITSPSGTHYDLAKTALEHGSHVLVEKPLTLNLAQARELIRLAERRSLLIAVGHIYRFFPLVDLVRQDLAAGKYGRVLASEVKVHWGHEQAYYDQAAWRGSWAQDGGALMNQSVHALDLMVWLLGSKATSIQGRIARLCHQMEAEDYGAAQLSMQDGHICRVEGTTNTPEKLHAANFYISTEKAEIYAGIRKGIPYIKAYNRQGRRCGRYISRFLGSLFGRHFSLRLKCYLNPHSGIYKDLIEAIAEGRQPRANGRDGAAAVENVLAIYRSALVGGVPTALPLGDFSILEMQGFFPPQSKDETSAAAAAEAAAGEAPAPPVSGK